MFFSDGNQDLEKHFIGFDSSSLPLCLLIPFYTVFTGTSIPTRDFSTEPVHYVWRGLGSNLDVVCALMSTGGVLRRSQTERTRESSRVTDQVTVAAGLICCALSHAMIHCIWRSSDSEQESNHKDLIMWRLYAGNPMQGLYSCKFCFALVRI